MLRVAKMYIRSTDQINFRCNCQLFKVFKKQWNVPRGYKNFQHFNRLKWKTVANRFLFYQWRQDCLSNCVGEPIFNVTFITWTTLKNKISPILIKSIISVWELDVCDRTNHALNDDFRPCYGVLQSLETYIKRKLLPR